MVPFDFNRLIISSRFSGVSAVMAIKVPRPREEWNMGLNSFSMHCSCFKRYSPVRRTFWSSSPLTIISMIFSRRITLPGSPIQVLNVLNGWLTLQSTVRERAAPHAVHYFMSSEKKYPPSCNFLLKVTISGGDSMSKCSWHQNLPVGPPPVWTSSMISAALFCWQMACSFRKKAGDAWLSPPSDWIGSTITLKAAWIAFGIYSREAAYSSHGYTLFAPLFKQFLHTRQAAMVFGSVASLVLLQGVAILGKVGHRPIESRNVDFLDVFGPGGRKGAYSSPVEAVQEGHDGQLWRSWATKPVDKARGTSDAYLEAYSTHTTVFLLRWSDHRPWSFADRPWRRVWKHSHSSRLHTSWCWGAAIQVGRSTTGLLQMRYEDGK